MYEVVRCFHPNSMPLIEHSPCTALIRTGSHRCERRPSLGRCKFILSFVFCFLSGVVG